MKTILTILGIIVACVSIYVLGMFIGTATAHEPEMWKMEIHYTITGERLCAHYEFETKPSCERAKDWFVEQAAWHGANRYQCILESQCQKL